MPEKRKLDITEDNDPKMESTPIEEPKKDTVQPFVHIEIGNILDSIPQHPILQSIASTNQVETPWKDIQVILKDLITNQCNAMEDKVVDDRVKLMVDTIKLSIFRSIEDHTKCPFTIQRLCELVLEPKKYYRMYIKYLRAVEKVLLVTCYWDDFVESSSKKINNGVEPTVICDERLLPLLGNGIELEPHHFDMKGIEDEGSESKEMRTTEKETGSVDVGEMNEDKEAIEKPSSSKEHESPVDDGSNTNKEGEKVTKENTPTENGNTDMETDG